MDPVSFEQWNEAMVEKYDIEAYYSRSNYTVRFCRCSAREKLDERASRKEKGQ